MLDVLILSYLPDLTILCSVGLVPQPRDHLLLRTLFMLTASFVPEPSSCNLKPPICYHIGSLEVKWAANPTLWMSGLQDTLSWLRALMARGWHSCVESLPTATLWGILRMTSSARPPNAPDNSVSIPVLLLFLFHPGRMYLNPCRLWWEPTWNHFVQRLSRGSAQGLPYHCTLSPRIREESSWVCAFQPLRRN